MKAVVVGCGRVGSAVALDLASEGWEVTCIDENEAALSRLGAWRGGFIVGHGMDLDVLKDAGVEDASAVVVATDGDNSNLVIGQVIQRRWDPICVVVRVQDPARAQFYADRGLQTVCPTKTTKATMLDAVRACNVAGQVL
jgi:trk system potassium uptake protein TrkA